MNIPGTAAIPGGNTSKDAGDPRITTIPGGTHAGDDQQASKDADDPGSAAIPGGTHWSSRGYLPHLDQPGLYQSITCRLHDSIPDHVIQRWKEELRWQPDLPNDDAVVALRRHIVAYEDAGHGACWLGDEQIATLVQNALQHFDGQRYRLIAWCIMPNHVHVLIQTFPGHSLAKILHSWKSFSAQKANELLARNGPFWSRRPALCPNYRLYRAEPGQSGPREICRSMEV